MHKVPTAHDSRSVHSTKSLTKIKNALALDHFTAVNKPGDI